MLFLLASSLLSLFFLYLIGNLNLRLIRFSNIGNPFLICWFGLFVLALLADLLAFWVPLNGRALAGIVCLAAFGWRRSLDQWRRSRKEWEGKAGITIFVALMLLLALAALPAHAQWAFQAYDTDLYHGQIVRWLNTYGLVPGLGNLHARFANNSAWLSVAALFDVGVGDGRSAWIMTSLLLCLSVGYFVWETAFARQLWPKIYALIMFVPIFFISGMTKPNLYYDSCSLLLHCVITLEILKVLFPGESGGKEPDFPDRLILALALTALTFMLKPLSPPSVVMVPALVLWIAARNRALSFAVFARLFFLPCLAAVVWLAINMALSGYPLFPVPRFALPFDWTMAEADVRENYVAVREFARASSHAGSGILLWFPDWLVHRLGTDSFRTVMLLPFAAGIGFWAFLLKKRREPSVLAILFWQTACLAYWFWCAPDPRFGSGFAWAFLGAGVALFCMDKPLDAKKIGLAGCALLSVLLLIRGVMDFRSTPHSLLIGEGLPPGPVTGHIVDPEGHPFLVYVPTDGEKCGNAELPCSPAIPVNLRMRVPEQLGSGFRPVSR